jgi:hypothetical protein
MSESDLLEDEESDLLEDEESILKEEEDLVIEICSCSRCTKTSRKFRGFGIQEDGPTLAQDALRKVMDTVIGMPNPNILETHELDELEDHRLDPKPYQNDFVEFLQMQQDRMSVGAIDDGKEVGVGSYMSPKSVLRMLRGLAPKDIFGLLETDAPDAILKTEEPIEVVSDLVSGQVARVRVVVG